MNRNLNGLQNKLNKLIIVDRDEDRKLSVIHAVNFEEQS